VLQDLIFDAILLACIFLLGAQITRAILGTPGRLAVLSLAFPLGGGVLTWFVFLLSWVGVSISLLTVAITYAGLLALATAVHFRTKAGDVHADDRTEPEAVPTIRRAGSQGWLWGTLIALVIVAALIAVGRSYSSWDANAIWAVKGYGIALTGTVFGGEGWGAWGLAYPLNTPLQIALFELVGGDDLPGSKLLFPFFYLSLLLSSYRFLRRSNVEQKMAGLAILLLATNPFIFLHATIGYANLPLASYLVMAVLWGIDGISEQQPRALAVSGLLFGLASWTRAEAISFCLVAIALLLVAHWITKTGKVYLAPWLIPFVTISGFWLAFGWTSVENSHLGKAMSGVLPKLLNGEFRLRELYYIPRTLSYRAVDLEIWGLLFPAAGILAILGFRQFWSGRAPRVIMALMATVALAAVPVGLFYVRSFTRWEDFIPLLNRSFDRAFLPASFMIVILAVLMHATDSPARDRRSLEGKTPLPSEA